MSRLSKEQLAEISERIQERLAEFECEAPVLKPPTPGVVRLIVEVIEEWREDTFPSPRTIVTEMFERQQRMIPVVARSDRALLEHTVSVTESPESASTASEPNGTGDKDADPPCTTPPHKHSRQRDEQLKAQAYAFIRSLAQDGIMPSRAEYDQAKPDTLITGQALVKHLGLKWSEMAAELGLTMLTPVERMNRVRSAQNEKAAESPLNGTIGPATKNEYIRPQPPIPPSPDVQVEPELVVTAGSPLTTDRPSPAPHEAASSEHTEETGSTQAPNEELDDFRPQPASPSYVEQMAALRRKLRGEAISFLRDIAVDGVMPGIDEYNTKRPADLPAAIDLMNRLGYTSWHDVAQDAGLLYKGAAYGQRPLQGKRKKVRR